MKTKKRMLGMTYGRMPAGPICTLLMLLLLGAHAFTGCDNSLKPIEDRKGYYSIYGYLDLYSETNHIRVHDLNEPLRADSTLEIDATVTLRNLDTGESQVLEDSVVRFEDIYTHNFRSTLPIRPGHTYRVTAEDPDGGMAFATTTTPEIAETAHNPTMPNCTTSVRVSFDPVIDPNHMSASIAFEFRGRKYWNSAFMQQGGAEVAVFTFTPRNLMTDAFENLDTSAPWCHELSSDSMWVEYTHYSADFFGRIDTDTLGIPGGAGRFGALYNDAFSFPIDTTNVCFPLCDPVAGQTNEK